MILATTPTITFRFPETFDLTLPSAFEFSITQGGALVLRKDAVVVSEHAVGVYLTQTEALKLREGKAKVQLNWIYNDGSRGAIVEQDVVVYNNQIKEELTV